MYRQRAGKSGLNPWKDGAKIAALGLAARPFSALFCSAPPLKIPDPPLAMTPSKTLPGRWSRFLGQLMRLTVSALTPAYRVLNWLVPKSDRIVLLGGNGGRRFSDNSRYLFESLASDPRFEPYWITRSISVAKEVCVRFPGRGLYYLSPRALWIGLRARYLFISHSTTDIFPHGLTRAKKTIILLNHGIPMKTMGYAQKRKFDWTVGSAQVTMTNEWLEKEFSRISLINACSEFERDLWIQCYRVAPENFWLLGMPRNDALFHPDTDLGKKYPLLKANKIVLYAPTYRDGEPSVELLPYNPDLVALERVLLEHDALLLIRPHYISQTYGPYPRLGDASTSRILIADSQVVADANALLPYVDVLVTDYSSIYFDFMLLDRPMIFAPYDLADYREQRGLLFDYNENTPGPKVLDGDALIREIDVALASHSHGREARQLMISRVHRWQDGKSCERIREHLLAERPIR